MVMYAGGKKWTSKVHGRDDRNAQYIPLHYIRINGYACPCAYTICPRSSEPFYIVN